MKHLFIVSNLLNALNQDPNTITEQIDAVPYLDKNYIPSYTSGNIQDILQVSADFPEPYRSLLKSFYILPCTEEQLLKFICIELPGELDKISFNYDGTDTNIQSRVDYLNGLMFALGEERNNHPTTFLTIGDVYAMIMDELWDLSDLEAFLNKDQVEPVVQLFSGDSSKQFTYFNLPDMAEIYDLRSALNQIRLIIEEGKGANLLTLECYLRAKIVVTTDSALRGGEASLGIIKSPELSEIPVEIKQRL